MRVATSDFGQMVLFKREINSSSVQKNVLFGGRFQLFSISLEKMNRAEIILAEKCRRSNEIRKMKHRKRDSGKEKSRERIDQSSCILPPITKSDSKAEAQRLAYELSMRANTPKTQFRKVQAAIRRRIVNGEEDHSIQVVTSFEKPPSNQVSNEIAPKKIVAFDKQTTSQVEPINSIINTPSAKEIILDEREIKISTELAEKGLTPRTKFRKLQANIKKRLDKEIPPLNIISP